MLLLSQRDSATAEQISRAMEDGLSDGTSRSSHDTSYTRPPVVELRSAQASDNERVLQSMDAASPNAPMIDGTPMKEEWLSELYGLVLKKCADHPTYPSPTCEISLYFESERKRINATHQELAKQPCEITQKQFLPHVRGVYYGQLIAMISLTEIFAGSCLTKSRLRGLGRVQTTSTRSWLPAMTQEEKVVAKS